MTGVQNHVNIDTYLSKSMTEINQPFEPHNLSVEATAARRQTLLDEFAQHPTEDEIWQTAYKWVCIEGDNPDQSSIAADIPASELISMADAVRQTPQDDRYDLMAQRASNGKYWFDVIEGFSSGRIRKVQADIIKSWVTNEDSPAHFNNALDIGTGAGKSLVILEGSADNVVGIDRNPALLGIAKERAGARTSLVQGSAEKLPFEDASFDLIVSQGLRAALDKPAAKNFLRELSRVMTPYGIYIEGHYYSPDDEHPYPELARLTETSKAMLTDMIGDSVSGYLARVDFLSFEEEQTLIAELGLHEEHHAILEEDGESQALITVITKEYQEHKKNDPASAEIASVLARFGEEHGFDAQTLQDIKTLSFEEAFEAGYSFLIQLGLDADEILVDFLEPEE